MLKSDVPSTSRLEELVLYSRPDQTCAVAALSRVAARQPNIIGVALLFISSAAS